MRKNKKAVSWVAPKCHEEKKKAFCENAPTDSVAGSSGEVEPVMIQEHKPAPGGGVSEKTTSGVFPGILWLPEAAC